MKSMLSTNAICNDELTSHMANDLDMWIRHALRDIY